MTLEDQAALTALEARLRTILPEQYQDCYDDVQPVSMGSAGLKYGADGKVAWNEMWATFCDLAMAGGPPHKGTLLQPASLADVDSQPGRYREVLDEICRGIRLVAEIAVEPSPVPGWVRLDCESDTMAGWLVRAIVMENVSARCEGTLVDLPAGPGYRVEKEIKNVVTVIAKTSHYWLDHMWAGQQRDISNLFAKLAVESPLVQPAHIGHDFHVESHQLLSAKMAEAIHQSTGLCASTLHYAGWLGLECPNVRSAIWIMRALVASNVLSRREGTALFVPVNPLSDPDGDAVAKALVRTYGFAIARGVL